MEDNAENNSSFLSGIKVPEALKMYMPEQYRYSSGLLL